MPRGDYAIIIKLGGSGPGGFETRPYGSGGRPNLGLAGRPIGGKFAKSVSKWVKLCHS